VSQPHNPLIANAFFRSGQIEAWGRGIEKMKKGCVVDNLPEPEFDISPSMFSICFNIRNNNTASAGPQIYSADKSGINSGINETRQKMLCLMLTNPKVTTRELSIELGIDRRNVESHIRVLKKNGALEREGARKNGRWVVVRQ
jgi:ATP-dependent DNA helicase RecG